MALSGCWKLDRSENMEAVTKAMGLPADKIPKGPIEITIEIQQDGDNFVLKHTSPQGTRESKFTVGAPMKESIMGVEVDATSKMDGGKLVVETSKGNSIAREIVGDELVTTITFDGATAKRYFKKC